MDNLLQTLEGYIQGPFILAYLAVYAAGILVSFTPCVYPVIPMTVAFIGGQSQGSRLKGLGLSVFYVLGMAITYTVLGSIAALTGMLFGRIQTNPWTYFIVANICILLGLSMLEVFELPLPSFLNKLQPKGAKRGFIGSFLVGAASGLVLGPCTAPVLAVLLAIIASQQNVAFGISLLFIFALGMGTLLIIIGAFTGLLSNMPHADAWMVKIKKLFGWILIATGEYFLIMSGKMFV
ncbi:MAG: sulfite exporter TauE/SafE family protein [Planctomycetes bacterium]|nr:sulfite exporter TauE/SafE family protein [Planctomycetota bacterium]